MGLRVGVIKCEPSGCCISWCESIGNCGFGLEMQLPAIITLEERCCLCVRVCSGGGTSGALRKEQGGDLVVFVLMVSSKRRQL